MSDLNHLDQAIADSTADASGDAGALADLQVCLITGLGLTIAMTAAGDARAANAMCERAAVMVFEQVAFVTQMLASDGRC